MGKGRREGSGGRGKEAGGQGGGWWPRGLNLAHSGFNGPDLGFNGAKGGGLRLVHLGCKRGSRASKSRRGGGGANIKTTNGFARAIKFGPIWL